MESYLVELEGVSKCFGRVEALKDLTFRLGPGVSYGLIGRKGAGKTTLLRLIVGLLRPSRGKVLLFGGDPIEDAERVKVSLGYLAEDQSYPGALRPADLFRVFRSCYPTWDEAFLESLIARFKIPLDRPLSLLSKGQARQVGLLCAVAHRPALLVLDEPAGGLDPVARRGFLEEVIGLLSAEKTTVLFSSHNLQEVERVANRIGILHQGKLLLEEDLDRLKEGSCQVLVEVDGLEPSEIRRRVPDCVSARRRGERWLLTLRASEAEGRERVEQGLGARAAEVRSIPLEDLFVALVGEEP